ncbi:hypothetical protein niasHT_036206 [Heterodera trifolii]|uniref:3'-5' exonuclease domain-containing protein n=1 Tax=Heterodera trifolii TaxID=157864 RepID=A0ABD2IIH7_9BILA
MHNQQLQQLKRKKDGTASDNSVPTEHCFCSTDSPMPRDCPMFLQKVPPFGRPPISAQLTNATTCICSNQWAYGLQNGIGFFLSVCVLSALRGNGVPNSKFKKRAQRRNARATERAQQLQTVVPDLFWLAKNLCSVDEFAFDFELTCFVHVGHPRDQCICLLQISTEDTDILVDVLVDEVRDNFGHSFCRQTHQKGGWKQFCNHGAKERTFLGQLGISRAEPLVDTSGGCRRNLRSLVYKACGVWLDKSLATADWTRRPLTKQMVDYARCDTHYLLRCYQHLMKTGRL